MTPRDSNGDGLSHAESTTHVSAEGGYLWRYSEDLARREGEGKASASTVWVQPPGTPSVGEAYLRAYRRTGDTYYLEAAKETAHCLIKGQLKSGGWDYRIEHDPTRRSRYAYRVDGEKAGARNTTTLDDNTTQAALRFLMRVDEALELKGAENHAIHDAVAYAIEQIAREYETLKGTDPALRIIDCRTFVRNLDTLTQYLAATRP